MSHSEICPICKGSGKSVYINYFVSHFSYYQCYIKKLHVMDVTVKVG